MKVLVIGANGFVGRNVLNELKNNPSIEVVTAGRSESSDTTINLLDRVNVQMVLDKIKPSAIVNCAGVVANTDEAYKNVEFCRNIFDGVLAVGQPYPKVIITGSAAEYGVVENVNGPVSEDAPLNATSNYGTSKVREVALAQEYAEKYGIDVTVARIFNPIGPGMGEKFLVTNLLHQIRELQNGHTNEIKISRLDAKRDYIDVRDVAHAIYSFVVNDGVHQIVQNVGSGKSMTNGELLEILLDKVELTEKPTIIETQDEPEPTYAAKADISRIKKEYNWEPKYDLNITIEDIVHGSAQH